MNNYILTGLAGRPSVKALYPHLPKSVEVLEKVDLNSGKELIRVHKNSKNFKDYTSFKKSTFVVKNAIVARWGNRTSLNFQNCVVYNTAEASAKAANKRLARELMNKAGIPIPKLVTKDNFTQEDLPIIGRPSYHAKCKNLRRFDTKESFLEHYKTHASKGWYYSKFINKEHEYRIHCAHGKVLSISEKPMPKNHTVKKPVIGWGYSVVEQEWRVLHWHEYKAKWCKLALDAMKVIGLDFGAVDIIVKDKTAYVLEINTAGSLSESPYLQKRYSMYFKWLFESNKKREHWKYDDFTVGKSFAWKNNQLA